MNKTLQNFDSNGGIPLQYDVFICHCSTDKKVVVDPLVKACTDAGINCWVDSKEIQWGDSISLRINEGLLKSRFVLVVISESTSSRTWQPREIAAAIDAENKQGIVRVLPLYVGNRTELEKQWPLLADKHSLIWDNNSLEIVQAIKSKLGHSQPVTSAASKYQPHIPSPSAPIKDADRESNEHPEQIALELSVKVGDIEKPIPEPSLTNASVLTAANAILAENEDAAKVLARLTRKFDQIAECILLDENPLKQYYDLILNHLDREESAKLSDNARHGLRAFKDFATMLTLPHKDLETVHAALERECVRVDAKCNETFVSYLVIARVLAEKVPAAARSRSIESLANDDCSRSITDRNDQWLIPAIVNIPQPADAGEFDGFIGPFTKGLASLFPIPITTADPVKEINRRLGDYRGKQRFVAAILPHNQQAAISTIHTTFPHLIVIVLPKVDDELYTHILDWRLNIEARINKA
jgi:hypothetical protein